VGEDQAGDDARRIAQMVAGGLRRVADGLVDAAQPFDSAEPILR